MKVVVNSANDETSKALGEQMVSDLNKIGYKATGKYLTGGIQYPYVQNSKNNDTWNVAWSAWYQDYPAPSDFLNVLLGCGLDPSRTATPARTSRSSATRASRPRWTRRSQMGVTDPEGANQLWAQVDHEMTDAAPWVDLFNPKQIDFLAKRVQNYQWNPQWYILHRPALAASSRRPRGGAASPGAAPPRW